MHSFTTRSDIKTVNDGLGTFRGIFRRNDRWVYKCSATLPQAYIGNYLNVTNHQPYDQQRRSRHLQTLFVFNRRCSNPLFSPSWEYSWCD